MPPPDLEGGPAGALAAAHGDDDDASVSVVRLRTDDLVALALGEDLGGAALSALAAAFAGAEAAAPTLILFDDAHRLLPPQHGNRGGGAAEASSTVIPTSLRRLRGAVRAPHRNRTENMF